MKKLFLIVVLLLSPSLAFAQPQGGSPATKVEEVDGSPSGRPRTMKFDNGSLTDNGDNSFTHSIAGGGSGIFLKLDQTTPQTVINGIPIFGRGLSTTAGYYNKIGSDAYFSSGINHSSILASNLYYDTSDAVIIPNAAIRSTYLIQNPATGLTFGMNQTAGAADYVDYFTVGTSGIVTSYKAAYLGNSASTDNPYQVVYGYITAAGTAKYVSYKVDDADDYFHLSRQDANILGFKIDMPLALNGDLGTGFLKHTTTTGALSIDTSTYLTAEADTLSSVMTRGATTGIQLTSTLAIGTSPFAITSTTVNTNLNADLLDGSHASAFATAAQTFYIGTTQVAINRASAALTLAGITLTTPNIGVATATDHIKGEPLVFRFTLIDPATAYAKSAVIPFVVSTDAAITVTRINVSCDADPATEPTGDIKYANAIIGLASPTVINDFDTAAGVRDDSSITSGAVASGKCMYISFDAAPDAAIKFMTFEVFYDYD